jgi:phosphatidylserine/phosphatidylglycerophosphate/cardiolipin synthase-like enzyme
VINEVGWGGTAADFNHEWLELYNNLTASVPLTGWAVQIVGKATITLSGVIPPQGYFLVTRGFTFSSGPNPDLVQDWPNLNNIGEGLQLVDTRSRVVDTLVYGTGVSQPGWAGAALQPYVVSPAVTADGLVLLRKPDPLTRLPTIDSGTARDWINDASDATTGRRGAYPGWDMERFGTPLVANGTVTVAIAPDGSFDVVSRTLSAATRSVDLEMYTFEHARLADLLAQKVSQGVRVRVLLDGAPGGGISNQGKWVCQRLNSANGGCWFMASDAASDIHARYPSLHTKLAIIDGRTIIVGSENFGPNGLPDDDKRDGTAGQRGMLAVIDSPALAARAQEVFDDDIDQAHRDITHWCAAGCKVGPPDFGFTPSYTSGNSAGEVAYNTRFATPLSIGAPVSVELATSPESNLRNGGIVALLNSAGAGDVIVAEQLNEPYYWGPKNSNPAVDPNPRLAAMIGAAARGARVRVVLDSFYDDVDDPRGNRATAQYLNDLARANRWDLRALTGNPTRRGIHNKLIAVKVGNRKYVQVGSWNGSEVSAKRNREMTVLIESTPVFDYVYSAVLYDFWISQPVFVPAAMQHYAPPMPLSYPLISEVMVDPSGPDAGREWVEIYNPSGVAILLNGYKIGDAEAPGKFGEGMYTFPPTATIPAGGAVVVAEDALAFTNDYGLRPQFAVVSYDPMVPALTPYTAWATGTMGLGNDGDQVLLLGPSNTVVDAAVWISDTLPGTRPFTGLIAPGHSLERHPPGQDSNDCNADFHDQPYPSPGTAPGTVSGTRMPAAIHRRARGER